MSTRWGPLVKQIVAIGTLVGAVWLVARVHQVLAPLVLAFLLAYLMSFPVNRIIHHTGLPRTVVVLLVQIVVLVLIALAPALVIPWLISLAGSLSTTLFNVVQEMLEVTPKPIAITPLWQIDLGQYYAPINAWVRSILEPDLSNMADIQGLLQMLANRAALLVRGAVNSIAWLFLTLVVSFYAVKDGQRLGRRVAHMIPSHWQPEVRRLWRELVEIWDGFVRGQLALGFAMGIIVWVTMSILGVRSAPALGLLSGLLEFVPAVGPVIAAVPGVLIALILGSTWLPLPSLGFAIVVALVYILLQQFENLYLLPRIVGRRVSLHPAVVILGALTGWQLAGILGILLAAPALACGRVLLTYTARKLLDLEPFPAADRQLTDPDQFWRDLVCSRPIRAVLFDIDGTLLETDDHIVRGLSSRLSFFGRLMPEEVRRREARRLLMRGELFANGLITLLDWLHLDRVLLGLRKRMLRWRGVSQAETVIAVPDSAEMLRTLANRGYSLAVVTSRDREETVRILDRLGIAGLFAGIITRDDVSRLKPHPMAVLRAAAMLAVPPGQCVMVGDTSVDVRSARAAGALAVGVLCGFGEPSDLRDADLVIPSTGQLATWL